MSFLSIKNLLRSSEECAWYLFLVMLPVQARHIFGFEPWGFVEWNARVIYATDILFALLLLMAARRLVREILKPDLIDFCAMALAVAAALSIPGSIHRPVSLFHLVKLIEGLLLFWYVRHYALLRFPAIRSLEAFLAGSILQAGIAIAQFMRQMDNGLWFLGESILSPHLKGIASFYISEKEKVIRAYGTTPHPNILATYLSVALFGFWYYFVRILKDPRVLSASLAGYAVLLTGFLMTFSRTVIFGWGLAALVLWVIVFFRSPSDRRRLAAIALATALIAGLFAGVYWQEIVARFTISADDEALTLRLYYGQQAFRVGSGGLNWNGIGIGNFVNWFIEAVPTLPRYLYQPVHNVYLLAYSETGILGSSAFVVLLAVVCWRFVARRHRDLFSWLAVGASLAILLFIGAFDHFPWTLQQGRLLWWLILGVAAARIEKVF